uniref:trypsin n=1 Tax=Anopheles farauti TaxID=69004 RepID=A0A182QDV6_9DIPT
MANRFVLCFSLVVVAATAASGLVAPKRQIVGGFPVDISEIPYQVLLRHNGSALCGGSIISPDWILTAAHCVHHLTSDRLTIRAGSSFKTWGGVIRQVSRIVVHPNYVHSTKESDCALLELEEPLVLNDSTIMTIDMPEQDEEDPVQGSRAIVSGWGRTKNRLESNLILRATFLPIVSRNNCRRVYGSNSITDRMLCAGFIDGGHDSCQGDSGGPLVVDDLLVGIVSFAIGCAEPGLPGVNARVSALRDWIREVSNV